MKPDDAILISVDDHVVEPPNMFDAHIPERWRDRAPRVIRTDTGDDVWLFEGTQIPNIGLNAVAGRPPEEYGIEPTTFEEMRRGCWDVHERVKEMNASGVLSSVCFPSFPSFSGRLFAKSPDKDLALAVTRAYNDWHIDEWCGAYPGRFIPMALPILWDAQLAADEVHRVAAKGAKSITFTENPFKLGYPSFHSPSWDPFWKALSDTGLVLSVHLGSSGDLVVTADDAPVDVMITLSPINICQAAADLLWSRVPREFPDLKIALSEGGTGWIPYFLERVDNVYKRNHRWTGQDFGDLLPSDVFKRQFLTCYIEDRAGVLLRDLIGIDNITWECDYPHVDTTWPTAAEAFMTGTEGMSDAERAKVGYENAMRWYSFDPFVHRAKEASTAKALRAEAAGYDVSIRSVDTGRHERRPVDLAELAANATG
jgi:predicted TIM-barrel fold metal-dependent hydrolase